MSKGSTELLTNQDVVLLASPPRGLLPTALGVPLPPWTPSFGAPHAPLSFPLNFTCDFFSTKCCKNPLFLRVDDLGRFLPRVHAWVWCFLDPVPFTPEDHFQFSEFGSLGPEVAGHILGKDGWDLTSPKHYLSKCYNFDFFPNSNILNYVN